MKKENEATKLFLNFAKQFENSKLFYLEFLFYFCEHCWSFEENQEKCFAIFEKYCQQLPAIEKIKAIPKLIEISKSFPKLVLLAFKLFQTLEQSDKERIKIPPMIWTNDDTFTYISNNEFSYRKKYDLPVSFHNGLPARPTDATDIECYYQFLSMCLCSKSECYCFLQGW